MTANDGEQFADTEGEQPIQMPDPKGFSVFTTPYDAPVRTLLQEIKDKDLIVNPDFQRGSVWSRKLKSRLIESLLLNIPIPVLYFAEDDDGSRVVIDGQQRLRAIEEFTSGQFAISDLQLRADLNRKRWTDLSQRESRAILNRTLRCVTISATSSPLLRFEMFERLNTGFVLLNDQELRNCMFQGSLNNLLNRIVHSPLWLSLMQRKQPDPRLSHHELVLRHFAVRSAIADYRPPLKVLLFNYMKTHRRITDDLATSLEFNFLSTLSNVATVFPDHPFRRVRINRKGAEEWDRAVNRAVFDVQMLGLADAAPDVLQNRAPEIRTRFLELCLHDQAFSDAMSRATADRARLYLRLRRWGDALANMGIEPSYLRQLPTE